MLKHVQELNLGNSIADRPFPSLFQHFPHLTKLAIRLSDKTRSEEPDLNHMYDLSDLEVLDLSSCRAFNHTITFPMGLGAYLSRFPKLKKVLLSKEWVHFLARVGIFAGLGVEDGLDRKAVAARREIRRGNSLKCVINFVDI